MKQHLRSSGKQAAAPSRSNSDRADRHTMVSITGYDDSSSTSAARPSKTYPDDTAGYGSLGYGNIAGGNAVSARGRCGVPSALDSALAGCLLTILLQPYCKAMQRHQTDAAGGHAASSCQACK